MDNLYWNIVISLINTAVVETPVYYLLDKYIPKMPLLNKTLYVIVSPLIPALIYHQSHLWLDVNFCIALGYFFYMRDLGKNKK